MEVVGERHCFDARGTAAAADGSGDGSVGQFVRVGDASQHQAAPAHVAASDKVWGKEEPLAENRQEDVDVLGGGDAAEEHYFARCTGQLLGGFGERPYEFRFVYIDGDGGEFMHEGGVDGRVGGEEAAGGSDDECAGYGGGRSREFSRVGEFAAKIETAAEGEDGAEGGVAALQLAGEFELGGGTKQQGGPAAPGVGRGKEKDAFHRGGRNARESGLGCDRFGHSMSKRTELKVAGKSLPVSNLDKVLYPEVGFTKAQVIDYYIRIAPAILPHLKKRPITLKRYPDGVDGFFFYEKQCPSHRPKWVKTTPVPASREGGKIDYCVLDDLPALVWAANLADLELHTFLHRAPAITRPTALAFDLDPGAPADIINCCKVALWLREIFDELGLKSFPKTSGSKGLQMYVPLNTATNYAKTKAFAHALAERLEREHPREVVSKMSKALRKGKVFIDWSQNDDHKTTINVYSLRARAHPTVSTPVTWKEVEAAAKKGDAKRLVFETEEVLKRVEKEGDLFAPVLKLKQKLPGVEVLAE